MPSVLSQKRAFHASLKKIHGRYWEDDPTYYDERHMAWIAVTRTIPEELECLVSYPTASLHFYPQHGDDNSNVSATIGSVIKKLGSHLELLDFHNTQKTAKRTDALRNIMPSDVSMFGKLPNPVSYTHLTLPTICSV